MIFPPPRILKPLPNDDGDSIGQQRSEKVRHQPAVHDNSTRISSLMFAAVRARKSLSWRTCIFRFRAMHGPQLSPSTHRPLHLLRAVTNKRGKKRIPTLH